MSRADIESAPRTRKLISRAVAGVTVLLLTMLSFTALAAPAYADGPWGESVAVTDSADPVTVGSSYTYNITGIAPTDCFANEETCDVHTSLVLDLRFQPLKPIITAASGSSGSCFIANQPDGYLAVCQLGVVPHASAVSATVTVTAPATGTFTAEAEICNDDESICGAQDFETTTYVPAAGADLATTVTDSADPAALGDTYTYTQTVTNNGPSNATGVTAATTLSGAGTIIAATPSQGSCTITAPTVNCSLGAVANAASATVTITIEPTATGTLTATTTVTGAEPDPNTGNNTAAQDTTINNGHGCTVFGGTGDDTLTGTSGNDVLCAFSGNDTVNGDNGDDVIYGGSGTDSVDGGNGNDTITGGTGGSTIYGGNGNDTITGGVGNDTIYGDNGNDTITGGDGNDTIYAGNGNDTVNAGVGTDTVDGGTGTDTCTNTENPTSCTP